MTSTTNRRLARVAALTLAPLALATVSAPGFAADAGTADAGTAARGNTGALTGKTLSARTVLTSTSGKKLAYTIGATGSSSGTTVTIGLAQGKETHMWSFKARASDFKVGSTGAGSLVLSNTQTGNRGRLSLKFSPVAAFRTKSCGGKVASRSRAMAVSGIAYFKTGTRAWGNVGKSTRSIRLAGGNSVTWTYDVDCPTPGGGGGLPTCSRATTWSAFHSSATTFTSVSGSTNGTTASVSAVRSVRINPAGASRLDLVTRAVPVPTFTPSGEKATLLARGTSGTMKIAGDGGYTTSYQCRSGSTTRTGTDTSWYGAATNNSPAFAVSAQVFGAFTVPNGVTATIGKASF